MDKIIENLESIAISIGIFILTIVLAWIFRRYANAIIQRNSRLMRNDPTNYKFLLHAIVALIYVVGIGLAIFMIPQLKTLASSLLAGAGILAVAVGFASQHALSNIISGIFIVLFKPFRVNDRLEVKGLSGIVEDITLRHTVIRDFENKFILIPNTVISDEVIVNSNFGENRICKWIEINLSFDSDIDTAKAIMREAVDQHPLHIDPRTPAQIAEGAEKVSVRVLGLNDLGVKIRVWAWASSASDGFLMECDVYETIKKEFDKHGLELASLHMPEVKPSSNKRIID